MSGFCLRRTRSLMIAALAACALAVLGAGSCAAYTPGDPEFRAFWVDAWHAGVLNQSQVDKLLGVVGNPTSLGDIRNANCNAVVIQVRRNADACYPSAMGEPYMGGLSPSNFNGLQAAIDAAHDTTGGKKRIEVHTWIVTFRTSGGAVYSQHDDTPTGSLANLDNYWPTRTDSGSETSDKAFDPGHPLCEDYTVNVAMDLVNNFDIDGVHFDYIRFTANNQGYNPTSIARYNARYGLTGQPSASNEQFKQWRRDQVSAVVRKVYAKTQASKPWVSVSGSFVTWNPSPTSSTRTAFQGTRPYYDVYSDWDSWLQEGIVDMAVPMTYYNLSGPYPNDWARWIKFEKDRHGSRHMYIGPGIYMNSLSDAITELQQTRTASPSGNYADGFSGYSYFAPFTYGGTNYGAWEDFVPTFQSQVTNNTDAPIPTKPWKVSPTKGHISGTITHISTGKWADGATVSITGPESRSMYVDGTGFYAFVDLTPGAYTVTASLAGQPNAVRPVNVAVGSVTGNMYVTDIAMGAVPPVITDVHAVAGSSTTATVTWTTDELSTSQVDYGTTTSYGSTTTLDSNMVTSHSVGLSGLRCGVVYHYRVRSVDSDDMEAVSGDYTFSTPADGTPAVITAVLPTNVNVSSAGITWTTDDPATSQVEYGPTGTYGTLTTIDNSLVQSHTVALSGLNPGQLYHYRVRSKNCASMETVSSDHTFTTTTDTTAPIITNVVFSNVTSSTATITWMTDDLSTSRVDYGVTTSYGKTTTLDTNMVTDHTVDLTNLLSSQLYHFRVRSRNAAGLEGVSGDYGFTTGVDTTPPVIANVQVAGVTSNSATITWTTDDPSTSQAHYGMTAAYGQTTTEDTDLVSSHGVTIIGLPPSTIYHYKVKSTNNAALTSFSGDGTFMTQTAPLELVVDNLQGFVTLGTWTPLTDSGGWPTTASQYVYASNMNTSTTAKFTWTPNVPVAGRYNVYCWYKAATADRTTSARYTIVYAGGQTMVKAVNQTINGSQWYKIADSVQFDAGTSGYVQLGNKTGEADGTKKVVADAVKLEYAEPDTTPPSTPAGLVATAVSTSQIDLTWSPSTDNLIVLGYKIYRNSQVVGSTSSTSYSDTGLVANAQCTYTVTAYDARSNESAQSDPAARCTFARPVSASHVTCDRDISTWHPTSAFTFFDDGFGPGKLSHYRYVWNNTEAYEWADTEDQWTTASMVLNATSAWPYWYLHVKGYNGDGVGCGTLDYGPYWYGTPFARIADAMNNPNGAEVLITQYKPITGVFGTYFYIEESDRTRGIRVDATTERSVGDAVVVAGRLTSSDGERRLADAAILDWTPSSAPLPLLTRVIVLGGTAPDPYTPGMPGASALYNIGLLVRVVGAVVSHTAGSFVLDDGSGARVSVYSDAVVSDSSFVGVSGICTVEGGSRVIRTRAVGDVRDYMAP
jgi:uncharacterized lipoprotein YddW (UPF0748 family)